MIESAAGTAQMNFDGVPEALDRVVPRSDLERDLLLHAKRSARSQKDPGQVADDALKGALNGIGSARAREIDACTAAKHRNNGSRHECRRRVAHSLSPATVEEAARTIRSGERLARGTPPLDLDMDLRK